MIKNKEFLDIVYPILTHKEFRKLRIINHHRNHTIFRHSVKVSFLTYKITKKLKLDYKSATRAALLHDFFLYDWRKIDKNKKKKLFEMHAFTHPKIALKNAKKYFEINEKEKDIVLKHMFPLCLPPKYAESWVVTLIDKYTALVEILKKDK